MMRAEGEGKVVTEGKNVFWWNFKLLRRTLAWLGENGSIKKRKKNTAHRGVSSEKKGGRGWEQGDLDPAL